MLAFVLPALLVSVHLARGGSTRGALGWMASLLYVAYAHGVALATPGLTHLYAVHLLIAGAAAYGAASLAASFDVDALPDHVGRSAHERVIAAFLLVAAAFFAGLWIRLAVSGSIPAAEAQHAHPLVTSIDGIVLVPLLVCGARWLFRREALGYVLAAVLLVKTTGTFLTLAVCSVLTWRAGLPPHPVLAWTFAAGLLASAVLSVVYFRQIRDL